MNTELLAILFTIGGVGVAIIACLISMLNSMKESIHRLDTKLDVSIMHMDTNLKAMETKWDANLKAMETKWETNLMHWDDKWERLITLFIEQGKKGS